MKSNHFFPIIITAVASIVLFGFSSGSSGKDHTTNPIVDQVSSDLQGITISITYDTNYSYTYYSAGQSQDTGKTATTYQLSSEKVLIHFPCTGESAEKFVIPQNKISAVIKTKYNMGIYDRTDYVFTADSLYVVNTNQNDGKTFTCNVYVLPSLDSKYEYQTLLPGANTACGMNKILFFKVLDFCSKHDIKY